MPGANVSVADHYHSSYDPFFDEQILINISEKVEFHVRHFKSSLPRQTRGILIMYRIWIIMLQAHVSKILEHGGQQKYVG